ncbi:LysE family transporter [Paractinoplanes atraurantiacus]|uniref:Arginine exporter protein ArgO n=1 Tax=Paractinoplanes atraurantiacus TaxID=1036182 RepID=A0A285IUI6_9ACTN|nr:LysE family transporter [Actinoplanes atraurantiacus]SNY50601.1 Arginine exporter protein ArgO [Actinoplanes atraurantiacus]
MSAAFLAGVVAGYGVALPMGAIGVLIAGLSARVSLRVGAAAGLGAATADGVFAAIAVAGGAAVATAIAPIAAPLRCVAAVVLLALAAMTARAAFRRPARPEGRRARNAAESTVPAERDQRTATPIRAYAGVLGLTLLNPATVIYFAALVLGKTGAGGGFWFVAGVVLASASWQLVIAGGGSLIGRWLTGERGRVITSLVSSAVIAVLAIKLLAA